MPREVERVAFRVAMLALDNVVRHAAAARVVIRLSVDGSAASLVVTDDGQRAEREPSTRGGRGLVDMRTAATEIGATLRVDQPAQGTRVELAWSPAAPDAGHHAVAVADPAGRRPTTAG
jgi:signal transduction histidine kinase